MIFQKRDLAVKEHHSQPCVQAISGNNILTNIAGETKEKTKNKKVITASDGVESEIFSEDLRMKEEEYIVSEKSEIDHKEGMMGDIMHMNLISEMKKLRPHHLNIQI